MNEERPFNWRALVAAIVFVGGVAGALFLLWNDPPPALDNAVRAVESPVKQITPTPPLTREELIEAAARAASAYASGAPTPPANGILVGRRFTMVLPFGCEGPLPEEAESEPAAFWRYDSEQERLRAQVSPDIGAEAPAVRAAAGDMRFEAAEGFWIERPWLRSTDCPVPPPPLPEPAPEEAAGTGKAAPPPAPTQSAARPSAAPTSGQASQGSEVGSAASAPAPQPPARRHTLGIVEYFDPGSRRATRRNGRAYSLVRNVAAGEIALDRGLRLVVEGRLGELPSGQPVGCWSETMDRPPVCLISAQFSRVAITDASGERVLAEWRD